MNAKVSHHEFVASHGRTIAEREAAHTAEVQRLEQALSKARDVRRSERQAEAETHERELDARYEEARRTAFAALCDGLRKFEASPSISGAAEFSSLFRVVESQLLQSTGNGDSNRLLGHCAAALVIESAGDNVAAAFGPDAWLDSPLNRATVAAVDALRQKLNPAGAHAALLALFTAIGAAASSCTRAATADTKERIDVFTFIRPASLEREMKRLDSVVDAAKIEANGREIAAINRARAGEVVEGRPQEWHEAVRRISPGGGLRELAAHLRGLVF